MPESKRISCEVHRERLIALIMDGKTQEVETPLADHLAACPRCRSLSEASRGLRPAFAVPDLYTPGLKYRTLKRLAAEAESLDRGFLRLMIPASLLSLLLWFVIPLLLLTKLLDYWLSRPWLALAVSAVMLTSAGFLVGCLAFVAVTGGKESEQRLVSRMKDLLEEFHA